MQNMMVTVKSTKKIYPLIVCVLFVWVKQKLQPLHHYKMVWCEEENNPKFLWCNRKGNIYQYIYN